MERDEGAQIEIGSELYEVGMAYARDLVELRIEILERLMKEAECN